MLILGMRQHERIVIEPAPDTDPNLTVAELFSSGPIVIVPMQVEGRTGYRRVGIASTQHLRILRQSLHDSDPDIPR